MICETEEIQFFAANICDMSKMSPVQLLLVKDKISSREIIHLDKKKIDSSTTFEELEQKKKSL